MHCRGERQCQEGQRAPRDMSCHFKYSAATITYYACMPAGIPGEHSSIYLVLFKLKQRFY